MILSLCGLVDPKISSKSQTYKVKYIIAIDI